jgi:hypothetical protein
MPEPIQYWNKIMQSGIFLLRYGTEMTDAGMLMLALVLWMPMPSYAREAISFRVFLFAKIYNKIDL